MGVVRALFGRDSDDSEARSGTLPAGFGSMYWGAPTYAGLVLDSQSALRSAAVAACRRVIVSSLLAMPAHAYEARSGRLKEQKQQPRIVSRPAQQLTQRAWLAQMANSLVLDGNMYGLVTEYTSQKYPAQVRPLAKSEITWGKDNQGIDVGTVNNRPHRIFPLGDLVIGQATPFLRPGQLLADSPVELALESIGAGMAAEKFSAEFFGDGAHPSSIITSAQDLSREQAQAIKDSVMASWQGRKPAVVGNGLEFEQLDQPDTPFIDLMRFEIEQACRFFGVPPSMVYAAVSGQAVTYANVGQNDIQFLKHSLRSWVDDIEDFWSSMLPGQQAVKLKPEGLLRMSAKERHDLYAVRLASETITVNEIRELEDEDPFGDEKYDKPGTTTAAPAVAPVADDMETP